MTSSIAPSPCAMPSTPAAEIALLIKTFLRPGSLYRLLTSLRRYYPDLPVRVLDDSPGDDLAQRARQACDDHAAEYLRTEPDIGLSAGRNRLVEVSSEPYLVLLDDDFIFTADTHLERLWEPVRAGRYDVVAGALDMDGGRLHYEGTMHLSEGYWTEEEGYRRRTGRVLTLNPLDSPDQAGPTELVLNFFAARREALLGCPWDEQLKLTEHLSWLLRAKYYAHLRLGYEPGCTAFHTHDRDGAYAPYRRRAKHYYKVFCRTWGITQIHSTLPRPPL